MITYLTYLLTYCLSRLVACRAATKDLHCCLSLASLSRVAQEWLRSFDSPSTVRLQVCLGLPRFLFPSGVHRSATFGMESFSIRSTWPIHLHLLCVMSVSMSSMLHRWRRSLLEIFLGQNILKIFLRQVVWNDDSFAASDFVMRQHSDPLNFSTCLKIFRSLILTTSHLYTDLALGAKL